MGKQFGENIITELLSMKAEGKTNRVIGDHFGLTSKQIHNLHVRYNAKQRQLKAGAVFRQKGRPRKYSVNDEQDKDNEIKQLKMENELLRSFLQITGRR